MAARKYTAHNSFVIVRSMFNKYNNLGKKLRDLGFDLGPGIYYRDYHKNQKPHNLWVSDHGILFEPL